MKKLVLITAMLVSSVAFAGNNEVVLKEILAKAEEAVHNGSAGLRKYDVKKFDAKVAMKDLKAGYRDRSCSFSFESGRRNNIALMKEPGINEDSSIAEMIEQLYKAKQIKAIISATWDNDSGDSEYCSIYDFTIYTVDGYVLNLEFNYTD